MLKSDNRFLTAHILFLIKFISLFFIFSASTYAMDSDDAGEREYVFIYQMGNKSNLEQNSIEVMDMVTSIPADLYEKTGIRIKMKNIVNESYEKAFIQEEADFFMSGYDPVLALRMKDIIVEPLVLVSAFKKSGTRVCIYTKDGFKDIKSLRGRSINISSSGSPSVYVLLKKMLLENNIDIPVEEFFGSFYKIPSINSAYQALMLDKIDAVFDLSWYYEFYSRSVPGMDSLKPVSCTGEFPFAGVFMRKGVREDDIKAIRKYFRKIHKNPVIKEIRTMLLAVEGKLINPSPELMHSVEIIYKEAVEKGWFEEALEFAERMEVIDFGQSLKVEKKSYKECKEGCKDSEELMECVDICMGE